MSESERIAQLEAALERERHLKANRNAVANDLADKLEKAEADLSAAKAEIEQSHADAKTLAALHEAIVRGKDAEIEWLNKWGGEWHQRCLKEQRSEGMISEVRPNPGNEKGVQCELCGATLVCLSCGNHRPEATAEYLKALARNYVHAPEQWHQEFLEQALETLAARIGKGVRDERVGRNLGNKV